MKILGIETSCDETSASVIEVFNNNLKVISNVVSSQIKVHQPFGGVVPSLAAREHVKNLPRVLKEALRNTQGDFGIAEIDLIAVTAGPGLISSLLVGTAFAKAVAWKYKKPVVPVNHIEGHIFSNCLKSIGAVSDLQFFSKNKFPALCLVVSGGHSNLFLMKAPGKYNLVGETVDDAAGEAFDKIARILELGYPGGPAISAASEKFKKTNPLFQIKLPRPMINSNNYDFSFAGLKTSVLYLVRNLTKKYKLDDIKVEVAHEAQEAITDVLVSKTGRAAKKLGAKSIMLSGGVSANKRLRQKLIEAGNKLGTDVYIPSPEFTTDNAAMIAVAGYFSAQRTELKKMNWGKVKTDANWEII